MGVSEPRKAGGGRVRDCFLLSVFTQEAGGPGRCCGGRSRIGVSQWALGGTAHSVNVDTC